MTQAFLCCNWMVPWHFLFCDILRPLTSCVFVNQPYGHAVCASVTTKLVCGFVMLCSPRGFVTMPYVCVWMYVSTHAGRCTPLSNVSSAFLYDSCLLMSCVCVTMCVCSFQDQTDKKDSLQSSPLSPSSSHMKQGLFNAQLTIFLLHKCHVIVQL